MADKIKHPTARVTRSVKQEEVNQKWVVVDAEGQTLGRLASQVAHVLRGKHKPSFTPHVDCGDFVIVLNASDIQLSGKRSEQKEYFHHTGYPGGGVTRSFKTLRDNNPEFVIRNAVKGMLPKNRLGRQIIRKLKVYAGNEHPHAAQQPEAMELKG